jgi:HAE1 family hydrophobic/amphiphilic exporter-1
MNKLPHFSVKYPTTVMMVVLAIILLGYISYQRLGIDLLPDLNSPRLFVELEAGEIPPEEIEELFVSRMEAVIARGQNVQNVSSILRVGKALITVEYTWDTDMDEAFLDLQKMMADFSQTSDADEITVSQHNPNAAPVMVVVLSYKSNPSPLPENLLKKSSGRGSQEGTWQRDDNIDNLRQIAENNIGNQLIRLPGVAAVETVGALKREIQVKTDAFRLQAYGLTLDQLANTIKNSNRNMSGGSVEEMGVNYVIRGIGEFKSIDEIKNLIVANKQQDNSEKIPIYLRDTADVEYVISEPENIVLLNSKRCIALEIFKESGYNTMKASESIRSELANLGKSLPECNLQVIQDQAGFIESAVSEVGETGLIGIILAVLVLYLFLRRIGVTAVVSIAIPISIVATFNLMYFNHLTLNIMTLGGLALGAGMLVDNAIVVVENIFRHQEEGKTPAEAAVSGTGEVGGAITSSTLTTIVVFLPIVYLHGAAGELFQEQAWTVAFSLLSSLFIALAVIPMLYSKISRGALFEKTAPLDPPQKLLIRFTQGQSFRFPGYGKFLEKVLKRRVLVIIAAAALVIVAVLVIPIVGSEFFPHTDQGELFVNVQLPEGTSLEQTEKVVRNLEEMIQEKFGKHFRYIYSRVGPASTATSELDALLDENNATIQLVPEPETSFRTTELTTWLDKQLSELPDIKARIIHQQTALQSTLGTTAAPLTVEIKGKDLDILIDLAEKTKEKMSKLPELTNIETGFQGGRPEIDIEIDRTAAAQFSLQAENIGSQLKNLLSGVDLGRMEDSGEYIDIKLKSPEISPGELAGTLLESSSGKRVRLDEVARLTYTVSPREITRNNQVRIAEIKAHISGDMPFDKVVKRVQKAVSEISLPADYSFAVTGEEKLRKESFGNLEFALLLAIVLVYMVMAAQFESLLHPFVILLTIPLAFVGTVFLQLVLGTPFNIMSFIGMIMLAGIAVNDSIILVDRINKNRKEGQDIDTAIVNAGQMRIRPIIMTSVTTILALLPLTIGFGEGAALRAPLAIAVIGGLFSSTALTLIVIPCVYYFFASGSQGLFLKTPLRGGAFTGQ